MMPLLFSVYLSVSFVLVTLLEVLLCCRDPQTGLFFLTAPIGGIVLCIVSSPVGFGLAAAIKFARERGHALTPKVEKVLSVLLPFVIGSWLAIFWVSSECRGRMVCLGL